MSRSLKTMLAINEISLEPFEWGTSDCAAAVARIVRAATGRDFYPLAWRTREQADAELAKYGGLVAAMTVVIGSEGVPPTETLDGDPLVLDLPTGVTAGVRYQDRAVCRTKSGFTSIPITSTRVLRAWRV